MARSFRLWGKKRGDRRTGSPVIGGLSEALIFGILFLLGAISLTYLLAVHVVDRPATADPLGWGFWLNVAVMSAMTLLGAGGVIYSVIQVGTSVERRSAMARRAADIDLSGEADESKRVYPAIPRLDHWTNSPGVRLAYRLPIMQVEAWVLTAAAAFFLIWNGIAAVILTLVIRSYIERRPDWFLTLLALLFVAIGVWATYYFVRQLMLQTGIGPTSLEISDHPLQPGARYDLFLSQAGRLQMRRLDLFLVCEEEATYRQGTDLRVERCRVFRRKILSVEDFSIEPSKAFEKECILEMPTEVMHSFQAKYNAVQWLLLVRGQARAWPVFERAFPIVVYPPGGPKVPR